MNEQGSTVNAKIELTTLATRLLQRVAEHVVASPEWDAAANDVDRLDRPALLADVLADAVNQMPLPRLLLAPRPCVPRRGLLEKDFMKPPA